MEEFNNKKMLSESASLKDQKITWILQVYIHTYVHIYQHGYDFICLLLVVTE